MSQTVNNAERCPRCDTPLECIRDPDSLLWACRSCGGVGMTVTMLRRAAKPDVVSAIWRAAMDKQEDGERTCFSCGHRMKAVNVKHGQRATQLDVCTRCQMFWLDAGEIDTLPPAPPQVDACKPADPRAREAAAMLELRSMQRRYELREQADNLADATSNADTPEGIAVQAIASLVSRLFR